MIVSITQKGFLSILALLIYVSSRSASGLELVAFAEMILHLFAYNLTIIFILSTSNKVS